MKVQYVTAMWYFIFNGRKLTLTFDVPSAQSGFKVKELLLNNCWLNEQSAILPELHLIREPTLLIYGINDFIPISSGAEIHKAIP